MDYDIISKCTCKHAKFKICISHDLKLWLNLELRARVPLIFSLWVIVWLYLQKAGIM